MQQWRSVFAQGPLKGAEQSFSVRAQAWMLWFLALNIEALHSSCPSPALFFSPSSLFLPKHPLFPTETLHSFLKSLVIGASRFFSFFPSFSEFPLLKLPYNSPFGLSVSIHSLATHPSIDTFCLRLSTKTYQICPVSYISNWRHHEGIRFSLRRCRPQRRHGLSHSIHEQPSFQESLATRRFGLWKW